MKKIFTLLVLCVIGITACSTDNEGALYRPAKVDTAFLWPKSSIEVESEDTSFEVQIVRNTTSGNLTVEIESSDESGIFTIPTNVDFKEGESSAYLTISYDELEIGATYLIDLKIADKSASSFANSEVTLSVSIKLDWEELGIGIWTDGIVSTWYGVPVVTWEVEVQEAIGVPGMYRLVNPYGVGVCPWVDDDDVSIDPCYLLIDARDPNAVFISEQFLGIDFGDGNFFTGSLYGNGYSDDPGTLGRVEGKIIYSGSLFIGEVDYGTGIANESILELP